MANTNRDLFMTFNVKKSTVTGGGFSFYITDKNTSNFFVQLITNVETNSFITKYVTLETASDYSLILQVVKPNKELMEVEGQLMDEKNAIYQFNLKDEEKDMIGVYSCEFWVRSTVNDEEEITTSAPWTYNVISSILSKADSRITKDPNYPIVTELRRDLENLASLSFDEDGNLLVTIDGITKTFVPKD
jgi:hypothetical protein